MTKEASRKITFLNLIMTLLIALYHMKWYPYVDTVCGSAFEELVNKIQYNFCDMSGFLAMSFFFTVSGFLFYSNLSKEAPVKHTLTKIKTRIFTLLVPFLIWNVVEIFASKVEITSFGDFLIKFTIAPPCGQLWYLLAVFIISLFSPLVAYLSKRKSLMNIFLGVILVFVVLKNNALIPPLFSVTEIWWWYGNLFFYLPAYILGAFIGLNFGPSALNVSLPDKWYYKILSIVLTIGTVALFLTGFSTFASLGVGYLLQFTYYLVPIALWLTISNSFFTHDMPSILDCAFFVYATHITAGNSIAPHLTSLLGITTVSPLGSFGFKLLLVASIYLFAILLSQFLKLIMKPNYFGALTGNRASKKHQQPNPPAPACNEQG